MVALVTLFCILCALILTHYRLAAKSPRLTIWTKRYYNWLEYQFNGGQYAHGLIAVGLGVGLPCLITAVAYIALGNINDWMGILVSLPILYICLEHGQLFPPGQRMLGALRLHDLRTAHSLIETGIEGTTLKSSVDIASQSIVRSLLNAYEGIFAPLFWFALLGPAGALLFRLITRMADIWAHNAEPLFIKPVSDLLHLLNWLPARATAAAFAIVGDFEDALFCWKTQPKLCDNINLGTVLASGAGALGVRLAADNSARQPHPELGVGDMPDAEYLQSALGMIWRVLILVVGVILLLTLANWLD